MCCKNFWKRIIPFALAFMLGLLAANLLRQEIFVNKVEENVKPEEKTVGTGDSVTCSRYVFEKSESTAKNAPMSIFSKPQARYTDEARKNEVQGTVTLRVTFLPDGKIGNIETVSGLPYGLTGEAIAAAKRICFMPPVKDGEPYEVTKTVAYTFTIY